LQSGARSPRSATSWSLSRQKVAERQRQAALGNVMGLLPIASTAPSDERAWDVRRQHVKRGRAGAASAAARIATRPADKGRGLCDNLYPMKTDADPTEWRSDHGPRIAST
jgi:hypothetical protein